MKWELKNVYDKKGFVFFVSFFVIFGSGNGGVILVLFFEGVVFYS